MVEWQVADQKLEAKLHALTGVLGSFRFSMKLV